jgi:hypothetical protein
MSLNFSNRAIEYIRSSPGESVKFTIAEVVELFQSKRLTISETAAAAIVALGGKRMLTAYEYVSWLDLVDSNSIASFIIGETEPSWISICETRYPGTIFLRDDGALVFEEDTPSIWFRSIEKLVETQASITECIGNAIDFVDRRVVNLDSIESFAKKLFLRIDESTLDKSVVLKGNGTVAVLQDARPGPTGVLLAAESEHQLFQLTEHV